MLLLLCLMAMMSQEPPHPLLSPVFGDHMVLQRDKLNTFWGWAPPGSRVQVQVGNKATEGIADASGKWRAKLIPPPAGGPYEVVVKGATQIALHDVLVGDVWLCAGQSNMELGLTQAKNGSADVAAATDPDIRLCMAARNVAYVPAQTNPAPWLVCTPENVAKNGWGGFSAVGYYFGRELRDKLKVPIGLIEVAWGGTSAEAWTSAEGLRTVGDFNAILDGIDARTKANKLVLGTYLDLWLDEYDPGSQPGADWQKADLDLNDWKDVQVPNGFSELGNPAGAAWFRKEIELPDHVPAGNAILWLGGLENVDHTWVNGKLVGQGNGRGWERQYWFSSELLHPGKNEIAVRVFDINGQDGFTSPGESLHLDLADGIHIALAGTWKGKAGAELKAVGHRPRDFEPNPTVPTVLANGMIAPLAPLAIRGVIWYQGETNSGRSYQYRRLLPALIADWRRMFEQGNFPFYIVSLASFMPRHDEPGDDAWAELREAQAMTAQHVPHAGLVITTDVGDAEDVHPKDKRTVGERLAITALALEYRTHIPYSGPVYHSKKQEGSSIRLSFTHIESGLVARGGELLGFAIAGPDHKWHWAQARIEGNTILVRSPQVSEPVAVRYAWASNPAATLFNGAGLPAVPFRTDDWPGLTANNR